MIALLRSETAPREAAVLDVGSNSVRLVVYRIDDGALTPFLNEKVMAGLGRNLSAAGRLSPEGVEVALGALRRFRALLDALGVEQVEAVATAAVRDAADGPDFVRRVAKETGVKLRVISGLEEGRCSALGVLAGAPDAEGVVGDLGGSSLELVEIEGGQVGAAETHPLGPLALMEAQDFDAERVAERVDAALAASNVLKGSRGDFHAVGGAWRALGRIDIALRRHPLSVLHHHEMSRADALRVIDFVKKQSRRSLEKLEEAAARRADALPYAAVVLERVLKVAGFERVILSSYGLREGLLRRHLPQSARDAHPLVATAAAFGAHTPRARRFGAALERWLKPVFDAQQTAFSPERDSILRAAACRLADIGAGLHPDQRGEITFDMVLRAPLAGISHAERAFLAAAVHHRYSKSPPEGSEAYALLLNDDQRRLAAALGVAMRLGADLSGRSETLLAAVTLGVDGAALKLTAAPDRRALLTEPAVKRLDPLAALLGLKPRIDV